ncbi:hypothetical protein [Pontimicrobium sp. MEBiC06410]|jgi:hypothetical protein
MAITISEIKNLTKGTTTAITDKPKLKDFDKQGTFSATIVNKKATLTDWDGFEAGDNIQVIWKDGTKVVARGVGGTIKKEGTEAGEVVITISDLTDVSKYSVGLNGQMEIGEEGNPSKAALVSVRIGNLKTKENPKADWIIDFSDKTGKAEGSEIDVKTLIAWIQKKTGDNNKPELPAIKDKDGNDKSVEDFIIEFKDFYYNITQKVFDFNIASKEGNEITFGDFTIKNVGFRVTNNAVTIEETTEEESTEA